jgi:hypothetical protein
MHLASRAQALIDAGEDSAACAEIERMPDDLPEKGRLLAIIEARRRQPAASAPVPISDQVATKYSQNRRRKDATQAHAARRASADGDYGLARSYALGIKEASLKTTIEAEIAQAEVQHAAGTE